MAFGDVNGVRLFWSDHSGDVGGVPLVFVHGWGADGSEWAPHVALLEGVRRSVVVDLRGHGRSSVPATGFDAVTMADDVAELVNRLACGPVVAVGHSMGGQIVSALAVRHPDTVAAVVVVDPGYGVAGMADELEAMAGALAEGDTAEVASGIDAGHSFTPASPAWIRVARGRSIAGTAPHVLSEAFAAMFTTPGQFGQRDASERFLADRRCPVLAFWADPEQGAWERANPLPTGSRVVVWDGAGHYLHEERPAELVHVLVDWLESLGL